MPSRQSGDKNSSSFACTAPAHDLQTQVKTPLVQTQVRTPLVLKLQSFSKLVRMRRSRSDGRSFSVYSLSVDVL